MKFLYDDYNVETGEQANDVIYFAGSGCHIGRVSVFNHRAIVIMGTKWCNLKTCMLLYNVYCIFPRCITTVDTIGKILSHELIVLGLAGAPVCVFSPVCYAYGAFFQKICSIDRYGLACSYIGRYMLGYK